MTCSFIPEKSTVLFKVDISCIILFHYFAKTRYKKSHFTDFSLLRYNKGTNLYLINNKYHKINHKVKVLKKPISQGFILLFYKLLICFFCGGYFPIQNFPKIFPKISRSISISPVMFPKWRSVSRISIARKSPVMLLSSPSRTRCRLSTACFSAS